MYFIIVYYDGKNYDYKKARIVSEKEYLKKYPQKNINWFIVFEGSRKQCKAKMSEWYF